jgi:hypothetical protein
VIAETAQLLCRNSLHPWTGPGPCPQCRANPQEGVIRLGSVESRRLFEEINPTLRLCTKCGDVKPLTAEFFHRNKGEKGGFVGQCKICASAYGKAWRAEILRDGKGKNLYRRRLRRDYNLTLEGFDAILAGWAIDHDHGCCPARKRSCGKCVRGLLCVRCNVGLSYFGDNPESLAAAGAYVAGHRRRLAVMPAGASPHPE